MIDMIAVKSSNLKAVGYDEEKRILYVDFLNGAKYQYFDVPRFLFEELLKADSKGSYLDRRIKKGHYKYQKVAG